MTEKVAKKEPEDLVDAIAPEVSPEDVEDDGKCLFERQLDKREPNLFFEAESHVRINLRRYCIFLIIVSCLPIFYSIIFCGPLELEMMNVRLVNPAFNKFDTNRQCTSVNKSLQNGFIALIIFYALKIYNKLHLSLLYLCLLFYFGLEVRNAKMELSKNRIAITSHERIFHSIELGLLILQLLLIFPLLVGGYYLIRHVHRKATISEMNQRKEGYEEEPRLLKKRMKVEKMRMDTIKKKQEEQIEIEKAELKEEEDQEELYRKRKSDYLAREQERKDDMKARREEKEKAREKRKKEMAEKDK